MGRQVKLSAAFGERYAVLGRLGRGGAGMVLKARQRDLKRMVAVKIVDPDLFDDRVMMERFAQEARVTSEVQHPNVLTVIDTGVDDGPDGDVPYIVYELIEGRDLGAFLEEKGGKLEPDEALAMMISVLEGLQAAHDHEPEILHRDIKPDNILVSNAGQVKIADFGIAKRRGSGPRTQTGMVVGTPTYMSPEQAQGLPLTRTSDLYSTAVMLYECLVGRPPFVAASGMEVAVMHVRDLPPPPSEFDGAIPPQVDALLEHALDKDPMARPASAEEFAELLRDARRSWPLWVRRMDTQTLEKPPVTAGGKGVSSSATGTGEKVRTKALPVDPSKLPPEKRQRLQRERRALAATGLALAIAGLAALHLMGFLGGQEDGPVGTSFAPIGEVAAETGCVAATVRWESRRPYLSRVLYREAGTGDSLRSPLGESEEPVVRHSVDIDDLRPGRTYELYVLYPDQTRSLRYSFETKKLEFEGEPEGRLADDGALHVTWRTNIPARGEVLARRKGDSRAAGERSADLRNYATTGEIRIPGFQPEDEVEFKILLYTEWWDKQRARNLENRQGPELFSDYYDVLSLLAVARGRREALGKTLQVLTQGRRREWPSPGDEGYQEAVQRVLTRTREVGYVELVRDFEESKEAYFESEVVAEAERTNWFRLVSGFHDTVQGLDARGVANVYEPGRLYGPVLRPLGTRGQIEGSGPWARRFAFRFVDAQDPKFEPVLKPDSRPLGVAFETEGAPAWKDAEVAIRVRGLARGGVVRLDLGDRVSLRFRGNKETAEAEDPVWLFHRVPPQVLSPVPLYATVGLYTAPGASRAGPVRVDEVVVWGRVP